LNRDILSEIYTKQTPKQVKKVKNTKKKMPSRTKEGVPTHKGAIIDRGLYKF